MPKLIDADGLFDATLSVFAERGYDGMTTREIAERAGVNEATIFRRHGTKAALVNAALTRALSATPFATLDIGQDVAVDLRNLVDAFAATTRALGGAVATLLVEAGRHPELRASTAPLLTNMGGAVRVLQAYQDRGALRREDPWQQLTALLAPFVASGLWARSGITPPVELSPDTVIAGFLDGHRA